VNRALISSGALWCLGALAGCSTVSSRIQEKSAAFAALSPVKQDALRQGTIEEGDTPDLVYIALGKPFHIKQDGPVTLWHYDRPAQTRVDTDQGVEYQHGIDVTFQNGVVVGIQATIQMEPHWRTR